MCWSIPPHAWLAPGTCALVKRAHSRVLVKAQVRNPAPTSQIKGQKKAGMPTFCRNGILLEFKIDNHSVMIDVPQSMGGGVG